MIDHIRHALPVLLAVVVCGLCVLPAHGADSAPDVRTLMTPEEFQAAGLDKLSPAELEALNRWVLRYTANEAPVQRRVSPAVKQEMKKTEETVTRTRIAGPFTGWSGKTVFRLENGQVWKQRTEGKWYHKADSPEVQIEKNLLGFWMLRVVGADRAIGVKRIE